MTNLGLTLLNMVLVRVTVGGVAYTAAVFAAEQGIGLLHWRPLPAWAAAVTLLVLDYTLSNFGFSVSWWDRLCGTYRTQLALGQVGMDIGLGEYRTPLHLGQLLLMPFRHRTGRASSTGARAAGLEGRDAA